MAQPSVLLLNLGSPDSTSVADVRTYLKEFLLDERVIDLAPPLRNLIVRGFILPFRPKRSAAAYQEIWTDEGSPLVATTRKQAEKLEAATGIPVAYAMRYRNPTPQAAIAKLKAAGATDVFVMPLYPHYAMSSYETAVVHAMEALREHAPEVTPHLLQPFYKDDDYIAALVDSAKPYLENGYDRLQFSFHGIPERHVRKSDPSHAHCLTENCCARAHPCHATCYRHQCFETVRHFIARADIPEGRHGTSFQSRLGREPWLTPFTDQTLRQLPREGVKRLLIICPAFITDCLETLEEINAEGREIFLEAGGESFEQIPCLNDSDGFVQWMKGRVSGWAATL